MRKYATLPVATLMIAAAFRVTPSVAPVADLNDNRVPAGTLQNGVLSIDLEATLAAWKPDKNVDTLVTIQAFAERGKTPTVPGPLIRVQLGTEIRVRLHNALADSTLVVHGFKPDDPANDTINVAPGQERNVTFKPREAGTYLYWGTTAHAATIRRRWGREAQLNGAIVIDAAGAPINDRIFVLSLIDIFGDSVRNPSKEDIWEVAINGLSWPHTERLNQKVGDTLRWRLINATDRVHPMHLHGFHFRALARGDGLRDTTFRKDEIENEVTEFMLPGGTARIEWTPTRPGNWLFHCHMTPHITPFPERTDSMRMHESHDLSRHPDEAMAGLVLGVIVSDPTYRAPAHAARHHERILVQQAIADSGKKTPRGFVIQRGAAPKRDSIAVPGVPLILHRGERTSVTVVNNLPRPTTVHWHGMELESVFDGVSGWSGIGGSRAPLVMPGDSFTVAFTPPRAGTYMYHTHMDEEDQMASGLYAPMLVLEPGESFDAKHNIIETFGTAVIKGELAHATLNGQAEPKPVEVRAGETYRFRLINIHPVAPARFRLLQDTVPVTWRPVSKDGAKLPPGRTAPRLASLMIGVGETHDFEWTPKQEGAFTLRITSVGPEPFDLSQRITVKKSR